MELLMSDVPHQPAIAAPVPRMARYLSFQLRHGAIPRNTLAELVTSAHDPETVIGLGAQLVAACDGTVNGLRDHPTHSGAGLTVPSTPAALWLWLSGDDRGELVHRTRRWQRRLQPSFELDQLLDAFQHADSRDLSGYVDGTENPVGDKATEVAFAANHGPGVDGSSFVAVQTWAHDLDTFEAMPRQQRDHTIGRRHADNEELDDAPPSAHVKRTAQESFSPEAFILRRSMPWAQGDRAGLVFVAFGRSFDAYEALLKRMVGKEDGVVDALFSFTRPTTGAYYWCPPLDARGHLDLQALDLQALSL
jgi:putative iron-dependent peroxidase